MDLFRSAKEIGRLNEIASILIKYGFSDLIHRLQLNESLLQIGKLMRIQMPEHLLAKQPEERARTALEEMGPTFIKLGQLLATRIDLLPTNWIKSFEELQDSTPILPFETLKPTLIEAFGPTFESEFRSIDPIALGSASMAQVHKAVTHSGITIILKIRKPNIKKKIESDIRLLHHIARIAEQQSQELRRYKPTLLVKEFERSLLNELNFTLEARNAERIAKNLTSFTFVKVPKVYWQWTSEAINAQEYIEGIPARDIDTIEKAGLDRKLIVQRGAQAIWKMVFIDGFFHADPHPGNFLILPNNRIAMLDFGMVGRLTKTRKQQLFQLLQNIILRNSEAVALLLLQWSGEAFTQKDALMLDIEQFIENYYGLSLNEIPIPQIIHDTTQILKNYDIHMPPDIAMFSKACITIEGFGRLLYPQFNLTSEAQPLIEQAVKESIRPKKIIKESLRLINKSAQRVYHFINDTPSIHHSTFHQLHGIDKTTLEQLTTRLEKSIYRLIQGTLLASLFIGSALIATISDGPRIFGMNAIGVISFIGVTISSGWLLLLMWWTLRGRS